MSEPQTLTSAFPQRPVAVKASKAHLAAMGLGSTVGLLSLGLVAFLCATVMPQIASDAEIFKSGEAIELVSAEYSCLEYTPVPFADCTAFYEYRNPVGEVVEDKATALFLFTPEWEEQYSAKIDGAGNVALFAFAAGVGERWLAVGLLVALLLGLALIVLWVLKRQLRELLLWRRLGASPDPILATVTKWLFEPDAPEGSGYRCHYSWEHRGSRLKDKQFFPCITPYWEKLGKADPATLRYDAPLWSSADRSRALALVSSDGKALLIPRSLKPLILTAEEQSILLESARP